MGTTQHYLALAPAGGGSNCAPQGKPRPLRRHSPWPAAGRCPRSRQSPRSGPGWRHRPRAARGSGCTAAQSQAQRGSRWLPSCQRPCATTARAEATAVAIRLRCFAKLLTPESCHKTHQHEPQWPWFLTGLITPASRQSTEVGRSCGDLARARMRGSVRGEEWRCISLGTAERPRGGES